MGNKIDISYNISNILIKEQPRLYDANDKFIVFLIMKKIYIFSFEQSHIIFSTEFYDLYINDIKFHPIYYNILAITSTSSVLLYKIEEQNLEKKVEFKNSSDEMLKTEFNPNFKNILATLSRNTIKIWDKTSYYSLFNINIFDRFRKEIRWSNNGNYLIYNKNISSIEIFCLKNRIIISHLDIKVDNFYLLEENEKILCLTIENLKNIILFDLKSKNEIFKIKLLYHRPFNSILDRAHSLLYLYDRYKFVIYDIKQGKEVYSLDIQDCMDFYILKDIYNKKDLFGKFIVYSYELEEKSGFQLYEFYSEQYSLNEINKKYIDKKALSDFWEKSLDIIDASYDYLSFENNEPKNDEINFKSYLNESKIIEKNKNLMANYTLKEKRNMVIEDLNNFKENPDLKEAYINYIVEIIKDNTKLNLLIKYLNFLNKNEKILKEYFTIEKYANEIKYYQICFSKELLVKEFNFTKKESEKEKFYKILREISELKEGKFDIFLEEKQKEYKKLSTFNQPISFENKEQYYFRNRAIILSALNKLFKQQNFEKLNDMKYCINEIMKRKLFENKNIINKKEKFTFLIILIVVPKGKIIIDYNLNLIEDENKIISENDLKELGFIFEENNNIIKYKDDNMELRLNLDNIQSINYKNLLLCIKARISFHEYQLYKYEQINRYYKKNIDEINIRKFLSKILCSNVIKESFSFFYGIEIKYPFSNEKDANNFINEYLQSIPLNNEKTISFTDKYTMETYILLSNKSMNFHFNEIMINAYSKEIIQKALLIGAIIVKNYHELKCIFHNYYLYITHRKLNMEEKGGGKNMERILFGTVLNLMNYKQALYILNESNYNKSLKEFQHDFIKLKMKDIRFDGIFSEYSKIEDNEIEEISDYMTIEIKDKN